MKEFTEWGKLLVDHSNLDNLDTNYEISLSALAEFKSIEFSRDIIKCAVVNADLLQIGKSRQANLIWESLSDSKISVISEYFDDRKTAIEWLTNSDE